MGFDCPQSLGEGAGRIAGLQIGQGHPALHRDVVRKQGLGGDELAPLQLLQVAPQQLGHPHFAAAGFLAVERTQQRQAVPTHLGINAVVIATQAGCERGEQHISLAAGIGGARQEVDLDQMQDVGPQGFRHRGVQQQQQGVGPVAAGEVAEGVIGLCRRQGPHQQAPRR